MKLILVTGGAKSGKSEFARVECEKIPGPRVYLATATPGDEEMARRIDAHKKTRVGAWDTFEETLNISDALASLKKTYAVILLDCLTLWLTNVILSIDPTCKPDVVASAENYIDDLPRRLLALKKQSPCGAIYVVTNEVGMGIVPENSLARLFRDLSGRLNQSMAAASDEVYFIASGIPIKIKG
jgi:adenosylcobinamide kinase/adenosylcobinamide-phosphate guanylyltransferase